MTATQTNTSAATDCIIQSSTVEVLALNKQYVPVDYSAIPSPWTFGPGPGCSYFKSYSYQHMLIYLIAPKAGSMLYVETDQAHGTQILWESDYHENNDWGAEEVCLCNQHVQTPIIIPMPLCIEFSRACSSCSSPTTRLALAPMCPRICLLTGMKRSLQVMVKATDTHKLPHRLGLFNSYRTLELVTDSVDPERVGLSRHRMTRLLAPWTQENPIFFHLTDSSDAGFRNAVTQMAEVSVYIHTRLRGS